MHPHLIHGSLSPPKSLTQMASWSVQPFLQGLVLWQTDRLTDHTTQSVTIGCIYVHSTAIWPKNYSETKNLKKRNFYLKNKNRSEHPEQLCPQKQQTCCHKHIQQNWLWLLSWIQHLISTAEGIYYNIKIHRMFKLKLVKKTSCMLSTHPPWSTCSRLTVSTESTTRILSPCFACGTCISNSSRQ